MECRERDSSTTFFYSGFLQLFLKLLNKRHLVGGNAIFFGKHVRHFARKKPMPQEARTARSGNSRNHEWLRAACFTYMAKNIQAGRNLHIIFSFFHYHY